MSLGSITFDAIYGARTDLRGSIVTKKSDDVILCLCAGLQDVRFNSEEGKGEAITGMIRLKKTSLPSEGCGIGDELTYTDADATVTQVRINGIKNQSGMTILAIEALI
jgi:CobQ-like glutamine amidotransferase family enzyme